MKLIIITFNRLQRNISRPESVPDTTAPLEADGTIPMKTVMKKVRGLFILLENVDYTSSY